MLHLGVVGQSCAELLQAVDEPHAEFAVRIVCSADHAAFGFGPERVDPSTHLGVIEHLVFERFAFGVQFRVSAQSFGERGNSLVDTVTHLVVGRVGHIFEKAGDGGVDLVEDAIVDGFRHPPWRLFVEALTECGSVVVKEAADADEYGVEQPLMMAAFDSEINRFAEQRGDWRGTDA